MQGKTAAFAAAGAVALGIASYLLLRSPSAPLPVAPTPASTAPSALQQTSRVRSITIQLNDVSFAIDSCEHARAWTLRVQGQPAWPVQGSTVQGFLRLLADTARSSASSSGTQAPQDAPTITLRTDDGTASTLRVARESLAGSTRVWELQGTTWVQRAGDARLALLLSRESVRAWRRTDLLQGPEPKDARTTLAQDDALPVAVHITNNNKTLAIQKNLARWSIIEPFRTTADQAAANDLARAQLPAMKFLDASQAAMDAAKLDQPLALIRKEFPAFRVDERAKNLVLHVEVRVGAPADPAGETHYASASAWWGAMGESAARATNGPCMASADAPAKSASTSGASPANSGVLWGPVLCTVSADAITAIAKSEASYVSRVSMAAIPADVTRITICTAEPDETFSAAPRALQPKSDGCVTLLRGLSGWTRDAQANEKTPENGDENAANPSPTPIAPTAPSTNTHIEAILSLLATTQCAEVLTQAPPGAKPSARVIVSASSGGLAPPNFVVGTTSDNPPSLLIQDGGIIRRYTPEQANGALEAIRALLK